MKMSLNTSELLARAMADLRIGLPVVLAQDDGLVILSAESAGGERLSYGSQQNDACLALTARRAEILKARIYDGDIARIAIPKTATVTWLRSVSDPSTDLDTPMKGPLESIRGGSAELYRMAILLARRARLLPAVLAWPIKEAKKYAQNHGLTCMDSDHGDALNLTTGLQAAAKAILPLKNWPDAKIHVFRVVDGSEDHCAVIFGEPAKEQAVLTRLHSACLTGDVLGSLKCDCGLQLRAAIDKFRAAGGGVLLYLNQEGRGIGLVNKVRAYGLQDLGYDTVEANHRLGFEDDERNFGTAAEMLQKLGFLRVRLLTNNPKKVEILRQRGIIVEERLPIQVERNRFNDAYLTAKARKSGHFL